MTLFFFKYINKYTSYNMFCTVCWWKLINQHIVQQRIYHDQWSIYNKITITWSYLCSWFPAKKCLKKVEIDHFSSQLNYGLYGQYFARLLTNDRQLTTSNWAIVCSKITKKNNKLTHNADRHIIIHIGRYEKKFMKSFLHFKLCL